MYRRFSFVICFIHSISPVYPSVPGSQFTLAPFPRWCPCLFSLSASLFLLCLWVHPSHFPRFHMYALVYLPLFYFFTLCDSLGLSMLLKVA